MKNKISSYKDTTIYSNEDFQPLEMEAYKHKQFFFFFLYLFVCEFLLLYYCNFNVKIVIWTYGITRAKHRPGQPDPNGLRWVGWMLGSGLGPNFGSASCSGQSQVQPSPTDLKFKIYIYKIFSVTFNAKGCFYMLLLFK